MDPESLPKMEPTSPPRGLKIGFQNASNFGVDFKLNLAPTWAPGGGQRRANEPRFSYLFHLSPNMATTWPNLAPTWPNLVSTWPQLGLNLASTWHIFRHIHANRTDPILLQYVPCDRRPRRRSRCRRRCEAILGRIAKLSLFYSL